jgi:hypothetical protein
LITNTNGGGFKVSIDTSRGHPEMDYAEHNRTYAGFLTFTKYSIVALVALLAGMFVFLV